MIGQQKILKRSWSRISTQLYLGLGGAVILTMGASLVGWYYFNRMGEAQRFINEGSVPEIVAAFGVAQQSSSLIAAAPRLATAATGEDFARVEEEIAAEEEAFQEQLRILTAFETSGERRPEQGVSEDHFGRIRSTGAMLITNIEAINRSVAERFELRDRSAALRVELEEVRTELDSILIPAIDDQLFYAMTGYQALGETSSLRPMKYRKGSVRDADEASILEQQNVLAVEFNRYRHLADLLGDATIAIQLLANSFSMADAALIEPLRERFEAAANRVEQKRSAIGAAPLQDRIALSFERLFQLGLGEDNGFKLRVRELNLAMQEQDLLANNRGLAIDLLTEVHALVREARLRTEDATRASTAAIITGQRLLLGLNVVSIIGAILIAYLYIGRVLLSRLQQLSNRMRRMAAGDLETAVEISGKDEVADMAIALEVFRKNALEVKRLNLVENLAKALKFKNKQLQKVLVDLRKAQDQIVMREKLAALGELTAGVAHEIKNPLNFVKNFSEVSTELLEELQEVLDEDVKELKGESKELIDEICGDLTGNLQRICEHGERANAIVHAMLSMGRGGGDRQPTDVNRLLDEHSRLAYHSARASDPEFNVNIRKDFDPDIGMIDIVAQDMGRVFLNMVNNACYATDEKRRRIGDGGGYNPTLTMVTRRLEDRIKVSIRDNGSGIPPDVVDKIFNPFFTTKPTDKGTGLGLALSNDIVREQGGSIQVESEPGEFTKMIIELPLKHRPKELAEDSWDDGGNTKESDPSA